MFHTFDRRPDIDAVIRELTHVSSETGETAFLYGRPRWVRAVATVWDVYQPFADIQRTAEATFLNDSITREREGESPDHLLEVPLAHVRALGLEPFILSDEHVAKIRRRIEEQRFLG